MFYKRSKIDLTLNILVLEVYCLTIWLSYAKIYHCLSKPYFCKVLNITNDDLYIVKTLPYKDPEEKRTYNQEYRQSHKVEHKEYLKVYNQVNKEEIKTYRQRYYEKNKERIKEQRRQYYHVHVDYYKEYLRWWHRGHKPDCVRRKKESQQRLRLEVLTHYGNGKLACACCGETHKEFLVIDHINNDGSSERKKLRKIGASFYCWLRKNNYPVGYQVLCQNCNAAKSLYGICPHQKERLLNANNKD